MKIYEAYFKNWNYGNTHIGYFSSKEKAEKALKLFESEKRNEDENEIKEHDLDKVEMILK